MRNKKKAREKGTKGHATCVATRKKWVGACEKEILNLSSMHVASILTFLFSLPLLPLPHHRRVLQAVQVGGDGGQEELLVALGGSVQPVAVPRCHPSQLFIREGHYTYSVFCFCFGLNLGTSSKPNMTFNVTSSEYTNMNVRVHMYLA